MAELSNDDRAVLAREGFLPADGPCWQCEAGGYVVPANRASGRGASHSLKKCRSCDGSGREGVPALHLLLAAIERRGWRPTVERPDDPDCWMGEVRFPRLPGELHRRLFRGYGDDPATALALAYVAAVRAVDVEPAP